MLCRTMQGRLVIDSLKIDVANQKKEEERSMTHFLAVFSVKAIQSSENS